MRRSLRSFSPAVLVAFLAFMPAAGVLAEDAEVDNATSDGSQLEPAGPDEGPQRGAKNLNTIPEDGLDSGNVAGPDNLLVRQLLSARPNEDLVICVAGCFSGRDRVVYAQPSEKIVRAPAVAPQSSIQILPPQHLTLSEPASPGSHAPVILNRTN
jgi:hypothetical protein